MQSKDVIEFNYQKALKQANELKEISKDVKKISDNKLAESLTKIDKNWDGENSKNYITKGNKLKQKLDDSAGDISKIADTIVKIAKNIYDAEMRAIEIAKTKTAK
ncbi:MAG: hypothetical protein NC300_05340 [Bacteroidales bacterium]|nr:hypothetical protein [Clostridium sp.]MCM1203548.1 hypothetical protein [Bacteroidales bacterium]